jgi:hypothetical protein
LLNELGFNSVWIEKCLAHEDGRSSRGVYHKAEYEAQRRHMMQEWSNIVDAYRTSRSADEHTEFELRTDGMFTPLRRFDGSKEKRRGR